LSWVFKSIFKKQV